MQIWSHVWKSLTRWIRLSLVAKWQSLWRVRGMKSNKSFKGKLRVFSSAIHRAGHDLTSSVCFDFWLCVCTSCDCCPQLFSKTQWSESFNYFWPWTANILLIACHFPRSILSRSRLSSKGVRNFAEVTWTEFHTSSNEKRSVPPRHDPPCTSPESKTIFDKSIIYRSSGGTDKQDNYSGAVIAADRTECFNNDFSNPMNENSHNYRYLEIMEAENDKTNATAQWCDATCDSPQVCYFRVGGCRFRTLLSYTEHIQNATW